MASDLRSERAQVPVIGVVIAAFNAAAYLRETLDSVSAQSFGDWWCVVVDDGSSDTTVEIARSVARDDSRFHVVQQGNAGPSAARNAGIAQLPGSVRWTAFLDSDDTWTPDALDRLLLAADRRPDAVGVYGLAEQMDADGAPIRPGAHPAIQRDRRRLGRVDLVDVPVEADSTFESLVVSGTIWPPAVGLFRRDVVERAGAYDPEQRCVEDWDLFLRMSRFGPLVPIDEQVAWYRQHAANTVSRQVPMAYYYARVRWKAWHAPDNTPEQWRLVGRVWLRLHLRAMVWIGQAALGAARRRDRRELISAARALALFARQLLALRPSRPDDRIAEYTARFVAPRSAGRGATAP